MFFNKSVLVSIVAAGLSMQVSAHAIIAPALGVSGTPVRNDVQRPSANSECGNVNVASTINTSTAITMTGNTFTATVTNFNAGTDGSRQVTAKVDATGAGKTFVAATVTENGDKSPTNVGSQQVTVQMPAGAKCTGGTGKDLCLVSFTTAGGFGNCVVVKQGAANNAAATNNNAAATNNKANKAGKQARSWGSRAARAARAAEESEEIDELD
ncbi:hypothetical protein NEOLEDRAFT_1176170 [Neolentinus lepideus HHB14362 ss-1]|uniref:Uncharacterized protein n=1 Tax=Neolentinus lepideus HHB14362 ss-1 TaxID=1314782 RepID=A0A165UDR3_9AGAM|nr:hypothetical protein NEOLEDRAFT_1176170 [Neolentinus lepideus HHB14362 ss-1]